MQDYQSFVPANFSQLVMGIFFYAIIIAATFLSMTTVYVIIRYSRSRSLGFLVSVIYTIIFLAIVADGISALNAIK